MAAETSPQSLGQYSRCVYFFLHCTRKITQFNKTCIKSILLLQVVRKAKRNAVAKQLSQLVYYIKARTGACEASMHHTGVPPLCSAVIQGNCSTSALGFGRVASKVTITFIPPRKVEMPAACTSP